jgi:hypothetical protein
MKIAIPPHLKTICAAEKLNTDLESAAQTLSNLHVSVLDEFSLLTSVVVT